jgi:hypothetical protein
MGNLSIWGFNGHQFGIRVGHYIHMISSYKIMLIDNVTLCSCNVHTCTYSTCTYSIATKEFQLMGKGESLHIYT